MLACSLLNIACAADLKALVKLDCSAAPIRKEIFMFFSVKLIPSFLLVCYNMFVRGDIMRLTLFTFCIYLLYCGLAFFAGLSAGATLFVFYFDYIGWTGFLPLKYFVSLLCGLLCAFLALGPAFVTHFIYTALCDKLPAYISDEIICSHSSSSDNVKDK